MPFTFKLSKRIAITRSAALASAALALACDRMDLTAPELPTTPLADVITSASLPVASVTASGDDGNVAQNTLDNSLSTRWSADGDGQWVRYDLGVLVAADRMSIAWYLGDTRTATFDIQLSLDAGTWTTVFSGKSSGTTLQLETYNFPAAAGRYLRIVGHGNSSSTWNSITEVVVPGTTVLALPVTSVAASGDDGNVARNTLDNTLATRWSANGDGQWIRYDLGAAAAVDRVGIAWFLGDARTSTFDLQVSLDASAWTTVFSGTSSGTTLQLETYAFPATTGRYIRIVGHGNNTSTWNSITEAVVMGAPAAPCVVSAGAWQTSPLPPQSGSFQAQFDVTPSVANMDGVAGLSNGPAANWANLAAIVRFNRSGTIDARNGGDYAAATAIPYTSSATYHFRLNVDIRSRTYDIYVTPAGSAERLLGQQFAFRTEQAQVSVLDNLGAYAAVGSAQVCNFVVWAWTAPVPAPVASVTVGPASASVTVGQTAQFTATLRDASGNVLTGRTVSWASSALGAATVSPTGLVTALALGTATITATSERQTGGAAVTVSQAAAGNPLYTLGNGNNYYVSPSGSDGNPCTASSPCYTMQRVSQLMGPGDNAHFAPGTYSWTYAGNRVTRSGTASALVSYVSDTKWGARVVGGCSPISNDGDYVQIIGFDVSGTTCPQGITTNGRYSKVIGNRVHDLPGSSGGYAGILGDCCYYNRTGIQIIGNVVDNIGPLGQTNLVHGIYLGGPNGVITNNVVTRASAACIDAWHGATNVVIANNTVANCGRYGIEIGADAALTTNRNSTVNNNIVVNVPGRGFHETNSVGGVFYNNVVYNNSPNFDLASGIQSGTITLTSVQFSALFVSYTGDMNGDYRLRSGAAAIDRGTTACAAGLSLCAPLLDFLGTARPKGTALDIGAYEY